MLKNEKEHAIMWARLQGDTLHVPMANPVTRGYAHSSQNLKGRGVGASTHSPTLIKCKEIVLGVKKREETCNNVG